MNGETDAWATGIAKQLVLEIAPEELPFFDELMAAGSNTKGPRDSYMGFGGSDAAMVLLTGALLDVAKYVAGFVWANGRDAAGQLIRDCSDATQKVLSARFADWIKNLGPEAVPGPAPSVDKPPVVLTSGKVAELSREVDLLDSTESLSQQNVESVRRLISRFEEA